MIWTWRERERERERERTFFSMPKRWQLDGAKGEKDKRTSTKGFHL